MTCSRRDQELLLLAHGELAWPRRLATQAHLRRCALCRERYARLARASAEMARALRGPGAPVWRPVALQAGGTLWGVRLTLFALALLGAVVLFAGYRVSGARRAQAARGTAQMRKAAPVGCAPDLPSDHCR